MKKIIILSLIMFLSSCAAFTVVGTVKSIITTDLDRRSVGTIADDDLIDFSLENWSFNNKKLESSHLNFNLYNKVVLITGEVPNKIIQNYITEQIKIIEPRIVKILNATVIMKKSSVFSRTNDSLIDAKVSLALNNQEVVNPIHIKVHTEGNIVYLMGDVTLREGKKGAFIAANVGGVKKVIKYFNYINKIPQRELDRLKKRKDRIKKEQQKLEYEQELQHKKDILYQQIKELDTEKK